MQFFPRRTVGKCCIQEKIHTLVDAGWIGEFGKFNPIGIIGEQPADRGYLFGTYPIVFYNVFGDLQAFAIERFLGNEAERHLEILGIHGLSGGILSMVFVVRQRAVTMVFLHAVGVMVGVTPEETTLCRCGDCDQQHQIQY